MLTVRKAFCEPLYTGDFRDPPDRPSTLAQLVHHITLPAS